jgi:hypothetical protein
VVDDGHQRDLAFWLSWLGDWRRTDVDMYQPDAEVIVARMPGQPDQAATKRRTGCELSAHGRCDHSRAIARQLVRGGGLLAPKGQRRRLVASQRDRLADLGRFGHLPDERTCSTNSRACSSRSKPAL